MAYTATKIAKNGYGQIELNQVAFRRDGRIEAQSKLADSFGTNSKPSYVENGMMLALNAASRTVDYPANANDKALLNYTTEHMYDERLVGALKDFKLEKGSFLPRLGYLATGDKFTTNTVTFPLADSTAATGEYASEDEFWTAVKGCAATTMYAHTSTNGYIFVDTTATGAFATVVKKTTMPDGQKAIQFIAL